MFVEYVVANKSYVETKPKARYFFDDMVPFMAHKNHSQCPLV